jgi:hypothetical protein
MDAVEKVIAYAPPFIYSKVTGIKIPTGVEAEGWLISVGGTPKQMLAHKPEFTYDRLLQAAKMAKRLGAQIMGWGPLPRWWGTRVSPWPKRRISPSPRETATALQGLSGRRPTRCGAWD